MQKQVDDINILSKNNLKLHYLATWWDILACAKKINKFDNKTLHEVENFLHNPSEWSRRNGGK